MLYAIIALVALVIFALQAYAKHYCKVNAAEIEKSRDFYGMHCSNTETSK